MNSSVAPFLITRTFAAPLDHVWRAWTEMDQFSQWFGPKGVNCVAVKREFRPGGMFHYKMVAPDGSENWGRAVYREIVPQEKLVWVNSFSNAEGEIVRPPFAADWPRELLTTVTFVAKGDQTEITVQWIPLNATETEQQTFNGARDGMTGGWTGTFEQLDAFLARN